jgi:peptide/nickel transport system permease protein
VTVRGTQIGGALLIAIAIASATAPFVAPHDPGQQFVDYIYAPPMRPHVIDGDGHWHRPFIYPLRLVSRIDRAYEEDRSRHVPLIWLTPGTLVNSQDPQTPWLLCGADALGRDIFARVLRGARLSLAISVMAAAGALFLGALVGAMAGFHGGRADDVLMSIADFVLVLPVIYVVVVLRASMPLVLSTAKVFWTMTVVMSLAGWPYVARGVRSVIVAERRREYAEAAHAIGAGGLRILLRHLLPAAGGFLTVQATLLVPVFILAEATLSFAGLGFAEPTPSWGVMLHEASRAPILAEAPWLLTPAIAIILTVLALNLAAAPAYGATIETVIADK